MTYAYLLTVLLDRILVKTRLVAEMLKTSVGDGNSCNDPEISRLRDAAGIIGMAVKICRKD